MVNEVFHFSRIRIYRRCRLRTEDAGWVFEGVGVFEMSTLTREAQKLQNIATFEKGKPPAQQRHFGPDAELYLTPEYLRGRGTAEPVKASVNAVRVLDGDTIVLWDGSNAGEIFRARRGILASTMSRISHNDTFDKEYFFYAVKYWESFLKGQTSGSGIPHVDKEVLGKIEIFEFLKPEQTKIAEVLSTVDQAIEQTEALIAKQQRIKTGLMQDLLTRGIDEHGNLRSEQTHEFKDSPLGKIPVEWDVKPLGQVSNLITNGFVGVATPNYTESSDGIPYLYGNNIRSNHIDIKKVTFITQTFHSRQHKSQLQPGDMLTVQSGHIGTTAVVPESLGASNCHALIITKFKKDILNPHFVSFYCNFCLETGIMSHLFIGSTIKHINTSDFAKFAIPFPSKKEQSNIVDKLFEIGRNSYATEGNLAKLRSLKTGLMQDLLNGKKRVTALLEVSL
jgi:type I restriction enzyme S subunit